MGTTTVTTAAKSMMGGRYLVATGFRRALPWLSCLAFWACAGQPPVENQRARLIEQSADKNVFVVLLDAAAAAHFGFMGYHRDTTPNLDAVAAQSIVFEVAYAQAASTPLSVYSLFSSIDPVFETTPSMEDESVIVVPPDAVTLAEAMSENFDHRLGVSANLWISRRFGFDQGFTEFVEVWKADQVEHPKHPRAEKVVDATLRWLDQDDRGRFFAYLHFLEPHEPYTPPSPYSERFDPETRGHVDGTRETMIVYKQRRPRPATATNMLALYDGNLAYADAQVGRLIDALKQRDLWDETIFVLIADHGEAFWQHGGWGHGRHVYDEYVRVPFLLRIPGLIPKKQRIAETVELVDLAPTLLELSGSQPLAATAGRSLVATVAGDPSPQMARASFFRNTYPRIPEYGIRVGDFKRIRRQEQNVDLFFDLKSDPSEQVDLAQTPPRPDASALVQRLEEWMVSGRTTATVLGVDSLDAATKERLRSIGYFR